MNTQKCINCAATLSADSRFCNHCGAPLPVQEQAQPQPSQQTADASKVNLVSLTEQREGAYTIKVPQGWKAYAIIQHEPTGGAVSNYGMQDPTGMTSISYPGTHFDYPDMPQQPAGMMGMMNPMMPFAGVPQTPYLPASLFIQRVLLPHVQRQLPGMQVEKIEDNHPQLLADVRRNIQATGENLQLLELSVASLQFTFQQQGQRYRQKTYMVGIRRPAQHIWQAHISGFLTAPIAQFADYEPLLIPVITSFQWNPQWLQAMQQQMQMLAMQMQQKNILAQQQNMNIQQQNMNIQQQNYQERNRIRQDLQQHRSNVFNSVNANRMQAQNRQVHQFNNYMGDRMDLQAPSGQVFNVANDNQQQHWIDPLGQYIYGGDWGVQPDMNWTPLSQD